MGHHRESAAVVDGFVPVIDLSARRSAHGRGLIAEAIGAACESSGFFTIVGHGVPQELIDRMHTTTNAFFELPDGSMDLVANRPGVAGFRRFGGTSALSLDQRTPPDLCEVFTCHVTGELPEDERARLGDYWAPWQAANIWPEAPAGFRDTWQAYLSAMTELASDIMRLFASALGLAEDFWDDRFDRHTSALIANYYYPQLAAPMPGQLRRGAHTDWGSLTILHQEDGRGGLQVLRNSGETSEWRDVPAIPGSFVVNIGDLMALWTSGRWVSTMHRVLNPERGNHSSRLSIPFFHQPNHDAPVEPIAAIAIPEYERPPTDGMTSGQWIAAKMVKTFANEP
ncbi:isopenicillin N synthase family dioxygenase [Streptomyces varsoviensis]|uniref:2OG-Fe(II) oxygenase n=1 Tax=Streptomyces varsoviensis TaxID=67373 RepID=A0ABR5J959_9ACTN|nr:2OG-Fe(II) oxygenase family protein [Streptomyces varsoviensis]KOG89954.1 2OG-Fe(II) oxygenase [Streptomyces varsoviensis]